MWFCFCKFTPFPGFTQEKSSCLPGQPLSQSYLIFLIASLHSTLFSPIGVVFPFTEPLLSQVGIHLFWMTPSSFSQISPYVKPSPGNTAGQGQFLITVFHCLYSYRPHVCISTIVFIIKTPRCNSSAYLFSPPVDAKLLATGFLPYLSTTVPATGQRDTRGIDPLMTAHPNMPGVSQGNPASVTPFM